MIKKGHLDLPDTSLKERCIKVWDVLPYEPGRKSKGIIEKQSTKYDPFYNPHTWEEFNPVLNVISTLTDVSTIKYSFMHVIGRYCLQNAHMHPDAKHSVFVFYPYLLKEHPPIEFYIDKVWVPFKCTTGDWLYFPKNMLHRVDGRDKDWTEDRIVISVTI